MLDISDFENGQRRKLNASFIFAVGSVQISYLTKTVKNTHTCKYCYKEHLLEYQIQKNLTYHLVYKCPFRKGNKKYQVAEFLSYVPNLNIPAYPSYKSHKDFYMKIDSNYLVRDKEAQSKGQAETQLCVFGK